MNKPNKVQILASPKRPSAGMGLIRPDQMWKQMNRVQQQELYQVMVMICWHLNAVQSHESPLEAHHDKP